MESDSLQLISSSLSEFSSLAAFGDFNNDKLTDVVVYSNNQQKITILTSLKNTFTVYKSFSYSLNNVNLTIINVIPIDFNYDGVLDLMLFGDGNSKIYIRVILSDGTIIELPPSTSAQPFITDFYGDLRPHLIGFPSDNDFLSIWSRSGNTTRIVLNLKPACKFAHPNSNAFIDIDGDCLPDLVFFCDDETVQIWLNRKGNWQATKDLKMPSGSGKVSFADIDGDGSNDLVFPSCGFFSSCFINISYNRQIQRNLDQLCISDPEFSFAFEGDTFIKIKIPGAFHQKENFLGSNGFSIRIGDFNNDGYPDLMILTEIPSILTVKTKVNLFKSIPCTIKLCTLDQTNKLLRTFILVENGVEDLNLIENPIAASFFDVGETGTLDIFVTSKTNTGEKRIDILLNNFFNDAFFLKSLVTNTASLKPYGVNYNGGTLKFSVTDTNGIRRPRVISQLPQTSYMALNTPYTLIGLGRTNNYIDDLFVGTSLNQTDHFAHFTGVIPNSQLIIIPKGDVDSWRVEMIVNPSKWILGVLGFLGGMLLFLGLVVWFFQRREDWEDEEERKRDAHLFNFEAL